MASYYQLYDISFKMSYLKTYKVLILQLLIWLNTSESQTNSSSLEKAYQQLVNVIDTFQEPKGIPFADHIPSPKCFNDRIAIVGAGPAGIHIAYLLKKKGFNNLVVLEKTNRVGGKSNTVKHRHVLHEMGTCYLQPDYEDNVIALAREFGLWEPVNIPPANVWLNQLQSPITFSSYVVHEAMKITGAQDQGHTVAKLFSAMSNYSLIHRQLFGKYDGELMRKPAPSTMKILRCTFYEFLVKYNLTILKPIFIASHTIQGYGHLDEVSALYGLMWNTPNYLKGLAGRFLGKVLGLNMIRGGFQGLWETVQVWEDIKVWFNTNIERLYRKNNKIFIKDSRRGWLKFDFLIWTPSLYSNLHLIDPSTEEKKIFSKLNPTWFTTTLFDSTYGIRGSSPIDYWISNVEKKHEHSVWAQRDSYGTLKGHQGAAYQNGSLPGGPDGRFIRTGVAYQYGKVRPTGSTINRIFYKHFRGTDASNICVVRRRTWEYFPRFSPQDMASGVLWDIFEMQGRRRTWFAGSSVIFESVKSVLEYNKLLVSKMKEGNYC